MASTYSFGESLHRTIVFSSIPVSGSYNYNNIFQYYSDDSLESSIGQEPLILEYDSSYYTDYEVINDDKSGNDDAFKLDETFRHHDFLKEILALLTLVTGANFYEEKINPEYILGLNDFGEVFFEKRKPKTEYGRASDVYRKTNYLGANVVLVNEVDSIFSAYFNLSKDSKKRFLMSLFFFYNSILMHEISPSMSFVSLVSSIENLSHMESVANGVKFSKCKVCNQRVHKAGKRFKDVIIKYSGCSEQKFTQYLGRVYNKRSNIAHLGELMYHDYASTELDIESMNDIQWFRFVVRNTLINWLLTQFSIPIIRLLA